MLLHELLQLILLLQFVAGGQSLLLLTHIEHHLLHRRPSLSVQIGQLGGFGIDLLRVDFDIALDGSAPPTVLVFPLLDVDVHVLALIALDLSVFNRPVSLLSVDSVLPLPVDQRRPVDNQS